MGTIEAPSMEGSVKIAMSAKNFESVIHYFSIVTVGFGLLLEYCCLILFVFHFLKKTPAFCNQYFYLLSVGYILAVAVFSISFLEILFQKSETFYASNLISDWFFNLFLGPWNTVLAINRSTAIIFWQKHPWTRLRFVLIVGGILAYPALGTIGMVIIGSDCFTYVEKCEAMFDQFDNYKIISNAFNVGISTTLAVGTVLLLRYKIIQITPDTKLMENHLLIQSIISSLLFGFYCIYSFILEILYDETEKKEALNSLLLSILFAISKFYLLYYHMSSTLLLFFLSGTVRKSFIEFYSFNQIKYTKQQPRRTRVTFLTNTPASH